jgi:hypothetical protein
MVIMALYPELRKKLFVEYLMLICLLLFSSCSSSCVKQEEIKFDPALKEKIRKADQNNPNEMIEVFIRVEKDLTKEMEAELKNTGVMAESVIGQIVTAKGTASQLREAAGLMFIKKIELSQKRESGNINGEYYEEIFY